MLVTAHRDVGQLPCLADLLLCSNLVVFQGDVLRGRVIQFDPRVGEVVDVVHDTVNVRLHQLVDEQVVLSLRAQHSGEDCQKEVKTFHSFGIFIIVIGNSLPDA